MAEGGLVNSATCLTEPTVSVRVKHSPLNHYVLSFRRARRCRTWRVLSDEEITKQPVTSESQRSAACADGPGCAEPETFRPLGLLRFVLIC